MDDLLKKVYRAFDPAPLTEKQQNLYVELDDARGSTRTVERLAQKIRFANGPTCQVLAGHRGSGKSTELYRLKKELEAKEPKYFVVYCRSDEYIDRNDVDFPDILIAIIRQLAHELKQREKITLSPSYFKDRFERLKSLALSKVKFESLELETALGTFSTAIKSSPDARLEIRRLFEPDTGNWIHAANDVIGKAILELEKKGYDGLVILVDDLDKMIVRAHGEAGCTTDEYLFVHRSAQLTAFGCHVVYSIPISLAYSSAEQAIKGSYGGHVPVVPMTKLATRPPNPKPHKPGFDRFLSIIKARLEEAGVGNIADFADEKIIEELIKFSGGQPSELMTLVREAIITHGLPIDHKSLERAQNEGRREFARMLRADHWPIIEEVRKTGAYERTKKTETVFRELLESRAVLQYINDDEWYGVNPMLTGLKSPTAR